MAASEARDYDDGLESSLRGGAHQDGLDPVPVADDWTEQDVPRRDDRQQLSRKDEDVLPRDLVTAMQVSREEVTTSMPDDAKFEEADHAGFEDAVSMAEQDEDDAKEACSFRLARQKFPLFYSPTCPIALRHP